MSSISSLEEWMRMGISMGMEVAFVLLMGMKMGIGVI